MNGAGTTEEWTSSPLAYLHAIVDGTATQTCFTWAVFCRERVAGSLAAEDCECGAPACACRVF